MIDFDLLHGISVHRARNKADLERVYEIRYRGYGKYFTDPRQVRESLDHSPGAVLLLAIDSQDNAVGTMRILDRRYGPIELDNFLAIDKILPPEQHPIAEATRFSVPFCPVSQSIKLALWKAYFYYCRDTFLKTILIAVRKSAARDYKRLLFENIGSSGAFSHPSLGSLLHETWMLDVQRSQSYYQKAAHPLYNFFLKITIPTSAMIR